MPIDFYSNLTIIDVLCLLSLFVAATDNSLRFFLCFTTGNFFFVEFPDFLLDLYCFKCSDLVNCLLPFLFFVLPLTLTLDVFFIFELIAFYNKYV